MDLQTALAAQQKQARAVCMPRRESVPDNNTASEHEGICTNNEHQDLPVQLPREDSLGRRGSSADNAGVGEQLKHLSLLHQQCLHNRLHVLQRGRWSFAAPCPSWTYREETGCMRGQIDPWDNPGGFEASVAAGGTAAGPSVGAASAAMGTLGVGVNGRSQ